MLHAIDELIYIHIDNQHHDTLGFVHECAEYLDKPLSILQSDYKNVESVIRKFKFVNSPRGAACTTVLKKQVRQDWEKDFLLDNEVTLSYVWGYDANESIRANRLKSNDSDKNHIFPLIDHNIPKKKVHEMLKEIGIQRPVMYNLGYDNNNCVGCVKGGMGYWNKIRVDFPDVFERMALLEREIGATCLKDKNGKIYLDELDPARGKIPTGL